MAAITSILPVPTQSTSDVLSQATESTDSTFKMLYYNIHGRGQMTRHILACADAKWEEIPFDWPAQKSQMPFRVVPVVWEFTKDGTILELAETHAIERYLCMKFNLYGKNEWENHKVDQFFTSTEAADRTFRSKVQPASPDDRVALANKYYNLVLPRFIEVHEEHLEKNGSNGHYVGNSTTLADIKTTHFIEYLFFFAPKGADPVPFSPEKTPNLWKVRETVNSIPSFAAFKNSERWRELDAETRDHFNW